MAADDAGEKTEQPTPRRLQEARERGQVARSADLTAAITLLGGLLLLNAFGPGMFTRMLELLHDLADEDAARSPEIGVWLWQAGAAAAAITLPFLLTLAVVAAGGTLLQTGGVIALKKLTPKLEHLSPIKGVQRLLSTESINRLVLGVLKIVLIAAVAYLTIVGQIQPLLGAATLMPLGVLHMTGKLLFSLAVRMCLVLLILGLIDYAFQRRKVMQQLRMTKQEVKDELKRMEGDPLLKHRRRQIQAKIAMQRLSLDVPKADVVVTNPTEYAVALRYDEAAMSAPRVVAKGRDFLALRIRQIAQQHAIPIVQRPPLARGLYATVEVGQEVPPAYYRAIAEVLAYVYQLAGKVA